MKQHTQLKENKFLEANENILDRFQLLAQDSRLLRVTRSEKNCLMELYFLEFPNQEEVESRLFYGRIIPSSVSPTPWQHTELPLETNEYFLNTQKIRLVKLDIIASAKQCFELIQGLCQCFPLKKASEEAKLPFLSNQSVPQAEFQLVKTRRKLQQCYTVRPTVFLKKMSRLDLRYERQITPLNNEPCFCGTLVSLKKDQLFQLPFSFSELEMESFQKACLKCFLEEKHECRRLDFQRIGDLEWMYNPAMDELGNVLVQTQRIEHPITVEGHKNRKLGERLHALKIGMEVQIQTKKFPKETELMIHCRLLNDSFIVLDDWAFGNATSPQLSYQFQGQEPYAAGNITIWTKSVTQPSWELWYEENVKWRLEEPLKDSSPSSSNQLRHSTNWVKEYQKELEQKTRLSNSKPQEDVELFHYSFDPWTRSNQKQRQNLLSSSPYTLSHKAWFEENFRGSKDSIIWIQTEFSEIDFKLLEQFHPRETQIDPQETQNWILLGAKFSVSEKYLEQFQEKNPRLLLQCFEKNLNPHSIDSFLATAFFLSVNYTFQIVKAFQIYGSSLASLSPTTFPILENYLIDHVLPRFVLIFPRPKEPSADHKATQQFSWLLQQMENPQLLFSILLEKENLKNSSLKKVEKQFLEFYPENIDKFSLALLKKSIVSLAEFLKNCPVRQFATLWNDFSYFQYRLLQSQDRESLWELFDQVGGEKLAEQILHYLQNTVDYPASATLLGKNRFSEQSPLSIDQFLQDDFLKCLDYNAGYLFCHNDGVIGYPKACGASLAGFYLHATHPKLLIQVLEKLAQSPPQKLKADQIKIWNQTFHYLLQVVFSEIFYLDQEDQFHLALLKSKAILFRAIAICNILDPHYHAIPRGKPELFFEDLKFLSLEEQLYSLFFGLSKKIFSLQEKESKKTSFSMQIVDHILQIWPKQMNFHLTRPLFKIITRSWERDYAFWLSEKLLEPLKKLKKISLQEITNLWLTPAKEIIENFLSRPRQKQKHYISTPSPYSSTFIHFKIESTRIYAHYLFYTVKEDFQHWFQWLQRLKEDCETVIYDNLIRSQNSIYWDNVYKILHWAHVLVLSILHNHYQFQENPRSLEETQSLFHFQKGLQTSLEQISHRQYYTIQDDFYEHEKNLSLTVQLFQTVPRIWLNEIEELPETSPEIQLVLKQLASQDQALQEKTFVQVRSNELWEALQLLLQHKHVEIQKIVLKSLVLLLDKLCLFESFDLTFEEAHQKTRGTFDCILTWEISLEQENVVLQNLLQQVRNAWSRFRYTELRTSAERFFQRAGFVNEQLLSGQLLLLSQTVSQKKKWFLALLVSEEEMKSSIELQKRWLSELEKGERELPGSHKIAHLYFLFQGEASPSALLTPIRQKFHYPVLPLAIQNLSQSLQNGKEKDQIHQIHDTYLLRSDPYSESTPVQDQLLFYGHEAKLKKLAQNLLQGRHVGLFGLRKIGKTSVAYQLRSQLFDQQISIFLDCQGFSNFKAGRLFQKVISELSKELQNYTAEVDIPKEPLTQEQFQDQFLHLFQLWKSRGKNTPFLIILDEVDVIFPIQFQTSQKQQNFQEFLLCFQTLRALAQQKHCLVLLVLSLRPDINRVDQLPFQLGHNPVYSSFHEEFLGPFSPEESQVMIQELGEWKDISWGEDTVQQIFEYCGGFPFLSRQFASQICEEGEKKEIDSVFFQKRATKIEQQLFRNEIANFLKQLRETLTKQEKELLFLIFQEKEFKISHQKAIRHDEEALASLLHYGLLREEEEEEEEEDAYCIPSRLLQNWFQRSES